MNRTRAVQLITHVFRCSEAEIGDVSVMKKGMTNRSFLFRVQGERYILRIPGEGTDRLIDRKAEAEIFRAISGRGFCDDPYYIDPGTGIKITRYLAGARSCDAKNEEDLVRCMRLLRRFHEEKIRVRNDYPLFGQINLYEGLRCGTPSIFPDYDEVKSHVFELKDYIDAQPKEYCLTHIDAVPDNFLFYMQGGEEKLQLTDWEYAGMQDPHVDIAMFAIYSLYEKEQVDHLIDLYFEEGCPDAVRTKIYCYVAVCGLLWSNWCEFKQQVGEDFGEYIVRQYQYAKDYYGYVKERLS